MSFISKLCYNVVCYKGTTLYNYFRNRHFGCKGFEYLYHHFFSFSAAHVCLFRLFSFEKGQDKT